ncbi:AAA domain-containing protein [Psychrobacter sp. PAMC 21119]|uniref:AAA domain-containing protein n=1 Tax=Psychrobacter sp. PAMC 21119 TaxID=1112209 RepID=UPI00028865A8|nr:AAA domain-containing protein [Psychrobacter sp. PAMC 21119]
MSIYAQRLASQIEFIKQCALMKKAPTQDFTKHSDFTCTEEQVLNLPGISLNIIDGSSEEVWLRLERLRENSAPKPSSSLLANWLIFPIKCGDQPLLQEKINVQNLIDDGAIAHEEAFTPFEVEDNHQDETLELDEPLQANIYLRDFPARDAVRDEFNTYLKDIWQPWLAKEKLVRQSIALYSSLFMLNQQLQGNLADAQLELVWGVGIALRKSTDNEQSSKQIKYPLLTQSVEITLDQKTMALLIKPTLSVPTLETEPFSMDENQGLAKLLKNSKAFYDSEDVSLSPFLPSSYEPILKSAVTLLDSSGVYQPDHTGADDRKIPKAKNNLIVTDTWVIMARPRSNNIFLQDLDKFAIQLENSDDLHLPSALIAMLTEPATENKEIILPAYRGLSMVSGSENYTDMPAELYFPKAFNDEQVQIIQQLDVHDGVVVQGPPGTGKTHTITNVICHYLALGKRVLVTSMKDPALKVLQGQLPESIRPLAVSLLTSENEGLKQFEHTIKKISSEVSSINREAYKKDILMFDNQIDTIHAQLASTDHKITAWARLNLDDITIDNETIKPIDAATEVAQNRQIIESFPDKLGIEENFKPRFTHADITALKDARVNLGNDLSYFNKKIPAIADIPPTNVIKQLHKDLSYLNESQTAEQQGELPSLINDSASTLDIAQETTANTSRLIDLLQKIGAASQNWTTDIQQHLANETKQDIIGHLTILNDEIKALFDERTIYLTKPITMTDDFDKNPELVDAVKNLSEGKKPFGLAGIFGKSAEKKSLESITIVSSAPSSTEDWQYISSFIAFRKKAQALILRWNALSNELSLPIFEVSSNNLAALHSAVHLYDEIIASKNLQHSIKQALSTIFIDWDVISAASYDTDILAEIESVLKQHLKRHNLAESLTLKETLLNNLADGEGNISEKIIAFFTQNIGDPHLSDEQLQTDYQELLNELQRVNNLATDLQTVADVTQLIEDNGAPLWAKKLRFELHNNSQDTLASDNLQPDDLLPDNWQQIWRIGRLTSFIDSIDGRKELVQLAKTRGNLEVNLARLYQEAITKRAWLKVAENATPNVRASLEKYRSAIMRIGKGTGKGAHYYRREAREASAGASAAIPCWIMPHYRISESLPAEFGSFDLVIIDEASQSDLTALPAIMRAKKVLIVGDDKQVSPEGVGLDIEKIRNLMAQYLSNQVPVYRSQMSPDRSIYDLFKVVFADSSVMLKEHFRSVAPIIEFSKREFYNHELIPLRKAKPSERLDPPLIDIYITDGYRLKGSDINPSEVRFIVDEIKFIVSDPVYKGKTIGVVSLLGNKQAHSIMEILNKELDEAVMTAFDIACGDARTFQGKERDIMFLSLVVVPGAAHAQTRDTFAQRMNVAASRARDRMYLVRSIELDELSQADHYRAELIKHFQGPFMQDEEEVSDLRQKCESPFETEVFDLLVERGYRVVPQVKAGAYRIDMVVEGENDNSLAIECDGDRYHGPDKWDSDMQRQRILERAGWKFWRCFASTFVTRKKEVIQGLLAELERLEIYPITIDTAYSSPYVESRVVTTVDAPQIDIEANIDANIDSETETDA